MSVAPLELLHSISWWASIPPPRPLPTFFMDVVTVTASAQTRPSLICPPAASKGRQRPRTSCLQRRVLWAMGQRQTHATVLSHIKPYWRTRVCQPPRRMLWGVLHEPSA